MTRLVHLFTLAYTALLAHAGFLNHTSHLDKVPNDYQFYLNDSNVHEINTATDLYNSLNQLAGKPCGTVKMVVFYASWCPHCKRYTIPYKQSAAELSCSPDIELDAFECAVDENRTVLSSDYPGAVVSKDPSQKPPSELTPSFTCSSFIVQGFPSLVLASPKDCPVPPDSTKVSHEAIVTPDGVQLWMPPGNPSHYVSQKMIEYLNSTYHVHSPCLNTEVRKVDPKIVEELQKDSRYEKVPENYQEVAQELLKRIQTDSDDTGDARWTEKQTLLSPEARVYDAIVVLETIVKKWMISEGPLSRARQAALLQLLAVSIATFPGKNIKNDIYKFYKQVAAIDIDGMKASDWLDLVNELKIGGIFVTGEKNIKDETLAQESPSGPLWDLFHLWTVASMQHELAIDGSDSQSISDVLTSANQTGTGSTPYLHTAATGKWSRVHPESLIDTVESLSQDLKKSDPKMKDPEGDVLESFAPGPLLVMQTIRDTVKNFFGCRDCQKHFLSSYDDCLGGRCEWVGVHKDDSPSEIYPPKSFDKNNWSPLLGLKMYLWRFHNVVTVRTALETASLNPDWSVPFTFENRDVRFPTVDECPSCRLQNVPASSLNSKLLLEYVMQKFGDNQTRPDLFDHFEDFNLTATSEYLDKFYWSPEWLKGSDLDIQSLKLPKTVSEEENSKEIKSGDRLLLEWNLRH